jgi:hopene-associated glycosyltransferase HpnB
MATIVLILSYLSLAIWVFLLTAWGQFWRCDQQLPQPSAVNPQIQDFHGQDSHGPDLQSQNSQAQHHQEKGTGGNFPAIAVVIPARNEADVIGTSIQSLLQQDYPGPLRLILVDDQSEDSTAAIAQQAAQELVAQELDQERDQGGIGSDRPLEVLSGQPLPQGWTGKLWALEQGTRHAQQTSPNPTYLLLTDADITHASHNLRQLVVKAEQEHLDLASLMVQLRCESVWERLLIPAFVFFFQKLYPFAWVNNPQRKIAAAAGGCILIRSIALTRIGGVASVRDALIDDCSLAAKVKGQRQEANGQETNGNSQFHPIWLGLSTTTRSLRPYTSLESIWTMVARTAYTQLNYSPLLLAGTVVGMTLVYLMAPLGLVYGVSMGVNSVAIVAGLTWLLMTFAYWPTVRLYGQSPGWALCLPLIAFLYNLMTLDSARRHWQGKGGAWKGRVYP